MTDFDAVKTKLAEIFAYYAPTGSLKSGKFMKLCLDAGVVERKVANADHAGYVSQQQVDVLFRRAVRKPTIGMTFEEFLDAMVELALLKYPATGKEARQAMTFFYDDFLSPFKDPKKQTSDVSMGGDVVEVVRINMASLEAIYAHHLPNEVNPHFQPPVASQMITSQKNFLGIFENSGLVPDFLSKATVYQVFREVLRSPPNRDLSGVPDQGSLLTFRRFVGSLVAIARLLSGIFSAANTDGARLRELLRWIEGVWQGPPAVPSSARQARQADSLQEAEIPTVVRTLFLHYARLGDPLNERWISSTKWSRFLKEGGVWASEPGENLGSGGFVSAVDADMLFVQAGKTGAYGGKIDLKVFHGALRSLAPRILPGLLKKGFLTFRGEAPNAWLVLTRCMLEPLTKALGLVEQQENENQELVDLMQSMKGATIKVYKQFADVLREHVMSREDFQKFVLATKIQVPLLVAQKIFNARKSQTRESLSFAGFEKALVDLAMKAVPSRDLDEKQRLVIFLSHLNNTSMASQLVNYPNLLFDLPTVQFPGRERPPSHPTSGALWLSLVQNN